MAEIAALGLASNIVQFVHFGACLFSRARELSQAVHGIRKADIELEAIAKDLESLVSKLTAHPGPGGFAKFSLDEQELIELTSPCREIANEILGIIDDLKVKGLHCQKWRSFKQALKHVRKEKEIRELESRLAKLQGQISAHLITTLSSQQSATMVFVKQLVETSTRLEMNTTNAIESLRLELLDALKKAQPGNSTSKLAAMGNKLAEFSKEGMLMEKQQSILFSLNFHGMRWRYRVPWGYDELVWTLDSLAQQTLPHAKFCFFVDGMDELVGDQRGLIEALKRLANCPPIKLCVSSQPWNIFINAFDGQVPQLKLETLTKGDIQKYINDKLGDRQRGYFS